MHDVPGQPESNALRELMAPEEEVQQFPEENVLFSGPPASAFERSRKLHKSPYNHEHLPVFRAYIELNDAFERDLAMDSVPRNFRYSLVDKLREDLIQVEILIYMIYDTDDLNEKLIFFRQARICCLDIRGRFRSLYRRKLLNENRFTQYASLLDLVAAEFKNWNAATKRRNKKKSE